MRHEQKLLILTAGYGVGHTKVAQARFSRIYLGLHYPSDCIAGGLIGTCSALFIVVLTWCLTGKHVQAAGDLFHHKGLMLLWLGFVSFVVFMIMRFSNTK
ncbi:phosphatase PAP2 family protein [Cohnella nanjingensis]|uniref:phosphatase PAP2 family protein n=1 Tax=Cohnella nanjingensis TaxID=1387779 RepID=UPI0028ACC468|nr:phosphatase PAP2 family protein [Cohnella nanjingensis]